MNDILAWTAAFYTRTSSLLVYARTHAHFQNSFIYSLLFSGNSSSISSKYARIKLFQAPQLLAFVLFLSISNLGSLDPASQRPPAPVLKPGIEYRLNVSWSSLVPLLMSLPIIRITGNITQKNMNKKCQAMASFSEARAQFIMGRGLALKSSHSPLRPLIKSQELLGTIQVL